MPDEPSPPGVLRLPDQISFGTGSVASLVPEVDAIVHPELTFRTAVADPLDEPARTAMAYGSLLVAMAFGSRGTHFSHALQYPVSAVSAHAARAGRRDAAAVPAGSLPLGHQGRARVEFCEEKYIGMEF